MKWLKYRKEVKQLKKELKMLSLKNDIQYLKNLVDDTSSCRCK